MSTKIYVLDRYANKNLFISDFDDSRELVIWDKITYFIDQKNWKKISVWTYIWPGHREIDKEAFFHGFLDESLLEEFNNKQKQALTYYPIFKKLFKKYFPTSIPVTARYHTYSKQYYFYFYSEERYQFQGFLWEFRSALGQNFFLFQVWARDMVKMSPATDNIAWCNGLNLCCKSNRPLPSVNVETLIEQHLEWRDIERLKWRCWKLKCSLLYEVEEYLEENSKYPQRWSYITTKKSDQSDQPIDKSSECKNCWIVTWYNIMNQVINIKTKEWDFVQISLPEMQQDYEILKSAATMRR